MLNLAPNFALGYNNLANVYYLKGEIDKAIENCEKAVEFGFEVHPDFLKMLEQKKNKTKKAGSTEKKIKKVIRARTIKKTSKKNQAKK